MKPDWRKESIGPCSPLKMEIFRFFKRGLRARAPAREDVRSERARGQKATERYALHGHG
jgi:hypothetical protein